MEERSRIRPGAFLFRIRRDDRSVTREGDNIPPSLAIDCPCLGGGPSKQSGTKLTRLYARGGTKHGARFASAGVLAALGIFASSAIGVGPLATLEAVAAPTSSATAQPTGSAPAATPERPRERGPRVDPTETPRSEPTRTRTRTPRQTDPSPSQRQADPTPRIAQPSQPAEPAPMMM